MEKEIVLKETLFENWMQKIRSYLLSKNFFEIYYDKATSSYYFDYVNSKLLRFTLQDNSENSVEEEISTYVYRVGNEGLNADIVTFIDNSFNFNEHSWNNKYKTLRKLMKKKIEENWESYKSMGMEYRNDTVIGNIAVSKHWSNYKYLSERLKNDKILVELAISQSAKAFSLLPLEYSEDREKLLWLLTINPDVILYIPDRFASNRGFINRALNANPIILKHLKKNFVNTYSHALSIVQKKGEAYKYLSPLFQLENSIALEAVRRNHTVYLDIPKELKTEKFIEKAFSVNLKISNYLSNEEIHHLRVIPKIDTRYANYEIKEFKEMFSPDIQRKIAQFRKDKLRVSNYIVMDLEMTGKYGNEIIEIALTNRENHIVYHSLVRPAKEKIAKEVELLTGIQMSDLRDKPVLDEIMEDVVNILINYDYIVVFGGENDKKAIYKAVRNSLKKKQIPPFCCLQSLLVMEKGGLKIIKNVQSLQKVVVEYGIEVDKPFHRATDDCIYTNRVLLKWLGK